MAVFQGNGFSFQVDEDAMPGRRLRLCMVPFSKHTQFGVADVHDVRSGVQDGCRGTCGVLYGDGGGAGHLSSARVYGHCLLLLLLVPLVNQIKSVDAASSKSEFCNAER